MCATCHRAAQTNLVTLHPTVALCTTKLCHCFQLASSQQPPTQASRLHRAGPAAINTMRFLLPTFILAEQHLTPCQPPGSTLTHPVTVVGSCLQCCRKSTNGETVEAD